MKDLDQTLSIQRQRYRHNTTDINWCESYRLQLAVYFMSARDLVLGSIDSCPLKLGGVLIFKIRTKKRVMKKLIRDRELVERGGWGWGGVGGGAEFS